MKQKLFTSESVTEGHPDKVCDQISDGILDAILREDPYGHVACETFCTTDQINVMGEISTSCHVDIQKIARNVLREIGYDSPLQGFDGNTCAVSISIDEQSPDIAMGVNTSKEIKHGSVSEADQQGAGDQGMMFGYACDETPEFMPLGISLAHNLSKQLAYVRKSNLIKYLKPDGKTQVTIEYEGNRPVLVDTIVIAAQHHDNIQITKLEQDIIDNVIAPIVPQTLLGKDTKILINPTGRFVLGGPQGDTGLTGRKIIVDTYGGYAKHGGGAFSGKDPSKVDRSAAYMARYAAKNIVAAGLARKCEIQIAYAIGVAQPVSVMVDSFHTGVISDIGIAEILSELFDFRPSVIIEKLDLRKPIYRQLATYGHFGREDLGVSWEKTDMVDIIRQYNKGLA
jgi:S-adenosylmethionine synthetase